METDKPTNTSAATAQLTVVRNSDDDTQTRQIVVYLDGQRMGELMFGQSITLPVASGHHTLRVDNTWNRQDVTLELHAEDHLNFLTKAPQANSPGFSSASSVPGPCTFPSSRYPLACSLPHAL
jgi:hypothetical protein